MQTYICLYRHYVFVSLHTLGLPYIGLCGSHGLLPRDLSRVNYLFGRFCGWFLSVSHAVRRHPLQQKTSLSISGFSFLYKVWRHMLLTSPSLCHKLSHLPGLSIGLRPCDAVMKSCRPIIWTLKVGAGKILSFL